MAVSFNQLKSLCFWQQKNKEIKMGNFSRDTFDKLKHYVSVRMQQGVPLVDADWNEHEDIRKHELRTFLKWFVGNGVPKGNDGFRIVPIDGSANDFTIKGGTEDQPGYCLVEGWDAMIEQDINYTQQPLYNNDTLAQEWGVVPLRPLSPPSSGERADTVYLDVWEREVDAQEDNNLVNPSIGIETCVRLKREWVVRVTQGANEPPAPLPGHVYYPLAELNHAASQVTVADRRRTGLAVLSEEITIKNGKVGIGTKEPDAALHVRGIALFEGGSGTFSLYGGVDPVEYNGYLQLLNSVRSANAWGLKAGGVLVSDDYSYANPGKNDLIVKGKVGIGITDPDPDIRLVVGGVLVPAIKMTSTDGSTGFIQTLHENGGVRLYDGKEYTMYWKNGNVGIGTASPSSKLHIKSDTTTSLTLTGASSGYTNAEIVLEATDSNNYRGLGIFMHDAGGDTEWYAGTPYAYADQYQIGRASGVTSHSGATAQVSNAFVTIKNNGNVGIGTTEPLEKLHVHRIVRIQDTQIYDNEINRYNNDNLYIGYRNTKNTILQLNGGNVGIGTSNPGCKLEIVADSQAWWGWYEAIRLSQSANSAITHPGGGLLFGLNNNRTFYFADTINGNYLATIEAAEGGILWAKTYRGVGGDYAEYFESKDGKEIKPGISVVLNDTKIRPAKKNEIPIGVISASPGLVGGVHIEWPKKHLRDEFGRIITEEYKEEIMKPKKEKVKKERQKMEKKTIKEKVTRTEIAFEDGKYFQKEITETVTREVEEPLFKEVDLYDAEKKNIIGKHRIPVMETYEEEIDVLDEKGQPVMVGSGKFETKTRPKVNPQYDETKEYIPREKRPEWNCVGLLGQLPLRKGQPTAPTWIKIKDISKDVELWLVK
jgi:hypothetical protein